MSNNDFHTVRGYQILNSKHKLLTSSMEDYLEMMYRMHNKNNYIRIKDLSKRLNVTPSSAINILKKLRELDYIDYEKYGIITLKKEGLEIGQFLLKRHKIVETFFKNIGIKNNFDEVEIIEHDISVSTLKELYIFNKFMLKNKNIKEDYCNFKNKIIVNFNIYKNP